MRPDGHLDFIFGSAWCTQTSLGDTMALEPGLSYTQRSHQPLKPPHINQPTWSSTLKMRGKQNPYWPLMEGELDITILHFRNTKKRQRIIQVSLHLKSGACGHQKPIQYPKDGHPKHHPGQKSIECLGISPHHRASTVPRGPL